MSCSSIYSMIWHQQRSFKKKDGWICFNFFDQSRSRLFILPEPIGIKSAAERCSLSLPTFVFPGLLYAAVQLGRGSGHLQVVLNTLTAHLIHKKITTLKKGVGHEVSDSSPPDPLTNGSKYFQIWFRFRRDIRTRKKLRGVLTPRSQTHRYHAKCGDKTKIFKAKEISNCQKTGSGTQDEV